MFSVQRCSSVQPYRGRNTMNDFVKIDRLNHCVSAINQRISDRSLWRQYKCNQLIYNILYYYIYLVSAIWDDRVIQWFGDSRFWGWVMIHWFGWFAVIRWFMFLRLGHGESLHDSYAPGTKRWITESAIHWASRFKSAAYGRRNVRGCLSGHVSPLGLDGPGYE